MYSTARLIDLALEEDIGSGDITTDLLIDHDQQGSGEIVSKQPLVLCGMETVEQVFTRLDSSLVFHWFYKDGDAVKKNERVMVIKGRLVSILKGERTALNFLQRLSGIATFVQSHVKAVKSTHVRIVDTRKTTPGWRVLEKYAVRIGGGGNHRMGLFDGVLIKDNHIVASGGIKPAINRLRKRLSHLMKIEIEVSNLEEVKQALEADADVIMLDNMTPDQIGHALSMIDKRAVVEVSGGIAKKDLKQLADMGVDIISIGALTHSAKSVDLSMRISNDTHS